MENSIFHRLSSVLWGLIVTLIVLLAIYVSVGRMLASNLNVFQSYILQELNGRVPFTVEADQVAGEWYSFTPVIVLNGLRLSVAGSTEAPLQLSAGRVGIDVFNSLRTRSLQLTRLVLDDLSLRGELTAQGSLRITGFDGGGQIGQWFREFLLNVELVGLRDNHLRLSLPSGETRNLDFSLRLTRDGSHRRVEANLVSNRGTSITALAEGVGDPFTPQLFSGELHLDIQSSDLGAVKDMLANGQPAIWADGALDMELWFGWNKGKPSLEARAVAHDLLVADEGQAWQVPLDRVALEARLIERKNRWTLFASNLEVEKDGVVAQLPRLQLDAWGDALRIRTADVPLQEINAIATAVDATPATLAQVFSVLQPRGMLSALQLSIGDIAAPASDWGVEANFDNVAINSWKGAPGLTSATGYLEIGGSGGFVMLDSKQLVMDFPTVYEEPLRYDDFFGTINLNWDEQDFDLSSGMITALGAEGTVNALFGLNIPLEQDELGLEMDLLVGLHDAHPVHRFKYVPYILDEPLRNWLADSIGDGLVEQGAFLWRGTLKRDTAPMRTVQLAFNVSDISLNYHPQWPQVTVLEGIVLIDDSNVSVWSERARLFASDVPQLSVEVWSDPQIMLAVDASVQGPASDGLQVLNDSPISDIVSDAFSQWTLRGGLSIDLDLQMNLTDKTASPEVDVATRWRDVDIDIDPGTLPLRGVSGAFNYSTARGFSSTDLVGKLWSKALSAVVSQVPVEEGAGADAAASGVDIAIATRADMADIRKWLDLESLAFARGETAVDVQVLVAPGEPPLLRVDSKLVGVELDLPDPWRKPESGESQLRIEMPLSGEGRRLALDLEGEVQLQLDVAQGTLRGGAMAVHSELVPVELGVLRVTGQAPLVQADDWIQFITEYFYPGAGAAQSQATAELAGADEGDWEEGEELDLRVEIDQLHADQLLLWGQDLKDVIFSMSIDQGEWHVAAQTDWFKGEYRRPADNTVSRLDIDRLDLSGMEQLTLAGSGEPLDFPDMDVTITNLRRADAPLGHLAFGLRTAGELLTAEHITGEVASMQLTAAQPGHLLWRQGQEGHTELKASLHYKDLGQVLGHFGYEKILQTDKGQFDFDLRWPGAPQDFSLARGQGSMLVKIQEGSFLEASSGASGALRVVSILNLADIVRRLSLSHMFESGIPFDSVKGEIFLHGGVIEVAGIDVKGPSSFNFSGVSDVAERSLQGELVATLPVVNNLAWVAALTASLPVAAGVYVMSRVFKKQVNRLASAVYSVRGSWDDPQVKFDHIFDDSSSRAPQTARAPVLTDATPEVQVEHAEPLLSVPLDPQDLQAPEGPPDPQDLRAPGQLSSP